MRATRFLLTEEVVRAIAGTLLNGDMGLTFSGVCTDSREVEPGFLFLALKGKRFDGHDFVKEALVKGAKGAIVERVPSNLNWKDLPQEFSLILTRDTLYALGELARYVRKLDGYQVIAITGSCGKTTTKEMAHQILARFYQVGKNEANYNNLIGVPLSILRQNKEKEWVVLEVATNRPGEIARLGEITSPEIAVITSVYPAHLEGLGDLEGVLKEKTSLCEWVQEGGSLVYFYDQSELREKIKAYPHRKIGFGFIDGSDLRILSYLEENGKTNLLLRYGTLKGEVSAKVRSRPQVLNLVCAMAIAIATGIDFADLCQAVEKIPEFYTRLKQIKTSHLIVLDDTYNANPASMRFALEYLSEYKASGFKKVVILGDMKELGPLSEREHRRIGELASGIAEVGIFVGELAKFYQDGFGQERSLIYQRTEDCVKDLVAGHLKLENSVVLVKGSRAMKMERIVNALVKG